MAKLYEIEQQRTAPIVSDDENSISLLIVEAPIATESYYNELPFLIVARV